MVPMSFIEMAQFSSAAARTIAAASGGVQVPSLINATTSARRTQCHDVGVWFRNGGHGAECAYRVQTLLRRHRRLCPCWWQRRSRIGDAQALRRFPLGLWTIVAGIAVQYGALPFSTLRRRPRGRRPGRRAPETPQTAAARCARSCRLRVHAGCAAFTPLQPPHGLGVSSLPRKAASAGPVVMAATTVSQDSTYRACNVRGSETTRDNTCWPPITGTNERMHRPGVNGGTKYPIPSAAVANSQATLSPARLARWATEHRISLT